MFLHGREELPNQSFLFYFLHAATVGGRGVCVAQTCTAARSACKTAHVGTTCPTQRSKWLRRCAFSTCAVVQPSTLRTQAALGSGFSLQAAFRYQNAMLALFLHGKKSLRYSPSPELSENKFQFFFCTRPEILPFCTLDFVVATIVAMAFLRRICSSRPGDGEQRGQSLAALTARGRGLDCLQPQPWQPVLRQNKLRIFRFRASAKTQSLRLFLLSPRSRLLRGDPIYSPTLCVQADWAA